MLEKIINILLQYFQIKLIELANLVIKNQRLNEALDRIQIENY